MAPTSHITVVTQRHDRRIMARSKNERTPGRFNLCGGELTASDLSYSQAKQAADKGTLESWVTCSKCRKLLMDRLHPVPART